MVLVQKELKNAYIGEWVDVTSLTLDKSSITLTTVGQTEQITATTVPAGATVNWSSSDTTVATVSSSGLVTCVTPGTCTITATTVNGLTASCSVEELTVQTFDFQNDGSLNWTGVQLNNGKPFYTSGEGWTVGSSSSQVCQEEILPPNSVYDGNTLQKVKIWLYKGVGGGNSTVGAGIMKVGWTPYVCWTQISSSNLVQAMLYDGSEHRTSTTNETGEVAIEYVCNDDGTFTLSINGGTPYNLGNYATLFRNARSGGTLGLSIGRWAVSNGNIYIRKVEITTA